MSQSPWHEGQQEYILNIAKGFDDLRRPANASNIESASTRYSFDYNEGDITFNADARIANERIIYNFQMPHIWQAGTPVTPHVHWYQSSANIPNWWIKYRVQNNGESRGSWSEAIWLSHYYTYVSGSIIQITEFPEVDMTGVLHSGWIDVMFGRDTGNVSGLFSGADPLVAGAKFLELDLHYSVDNHNLEQ